jgi:hypothetical protein
MTWSESVPYVALAVSILSFFTSLYFGFRDRVWVRAVSTFYPAHPEYDRAHLRIRVVNRGRRIAILTMFGGDTADGRWQGEGLGEKQRGLHLTEHQFYERKFYREDIVASCPDSESQYVELWFEDSLGKRHKIKNSREHIGQLKNENEI